MYSIQQIITLLLNNQVIAYPTETVFGLGCNPFNEDAIIKILTLKQRPLNKGLLVIAPSFQLLRPFIDITLLNQDELNLLQSPMPTPTSWLVPANTNTSKLLTGEYSTIGVRLCQHPIVEYICQQTDFALVSTSANLSGMPVCTNITEVQQQFGIDFPIIGDTITPNTKSSTIIDIKTKQVLRT